MNLQREIACLNKSRERLDEEFVLARLLGLEVHKLSCVLYVGTISLMISSQQFDSLQLCTVHTCKINII